MGIESRFYELKKGHKTSSATNMLDMHDKKNEVKVI